MMFIAVDLPEPGRSHDGDEFAAPDRQVDAGQRMHLGLALAVGLPDLLGTRSAVPGVPHGSAARPAARR